MLAMPPTFASALARDELSILVVYVNFAVGAALARRLIDVGVVELATARSGPHRLSGPCRFDAVLACPYLSEPDQRALLEAWAEARPRPGLLELEGRDRGHAGAHSRHGRRAQAGGPCRALPSAGRGDRRAGVSGRRRLAAGLAAAALGLCLAGPAAAAPRASSA
jgi:hypothetical protein